MSRKSLYSLLTAVVLLALALSGCGTATATPPASTTAPATPEPTATAAEAGEATPTAGASTGGQPLWTPELKQAIAAAIDREVIVDRVFEGRNVPAYSMVPPGYPYATTEPFLDKYGTRDLPMAISILEGLGYTPENKFEFNLWYPPEHYGTTTADVMQVIKEQLEETNLITVNLNSQNWAEYVNSFVAGDAFPLFILGWFPDFADPDNWLTPFASCVQSPDNGVNYCDPKMDDLLQRAAASADPVERDAALYRDRHVLRRAGAHPPALLGARVHHVPRWRRGCEDRSRPLSSTTTSWTSRPTLRTLQARRARSSSVRPMRSTASIRRMPTRPTTGRS